MHDFKGEIPIVYIVDSDSSVRRAIKRLIESAGMDGKTFSSTGEFLRSDCRELNSCLILDVNRPGERNLDIRDELAERGCDIPVIFITASDDKLLINQVKGKGASSLFRKPVDDMALLDAIRWALNKAE